VNPNQTSQKSNWLCPCNGCVKARKQAFKEVADILEGGGDAYSRIHAIKKLIDNGIMIKKG
jgi:hypothetical protein